MSVLVIQVSFLYMLYVHMFYTFVICKVQWMHLISINSNDEL